MNNIKFYKYIEQESREGFDFFIIQITYTDGQQRYFQVKVNKEFESIDSKEKRTELFYKLKKIGVLDFGSEEEELDLQRLMTSRHNKEEPNNGGSIKYYKFLKREDAEGFDIYPIRITYSNGKQRIFRVKVNKGSVAIDNKDIEKNLVERLKNRGALDFESTHQEVYLQTLIMHNGELRIKETLEQQSLENSSRNTNKGKHYFCSDIHGMWGSYKEALSKLKPEDHLIILGDAIDRGKYGIKIILDIMERQEQNGKKTSVTYFLGNHDGMLIRFMEINDKYAITEMELDAIYNARIYEGTKRYRNLRIKDLERMIGENQQKLQLGDLTDTNRIAQLKREIIKFTEKLKQLKQEMREDKEKKQYEVYLNMVDEMKRKKGISEKEIKFIQDWIRGNEGLPTAQAYIKLPKEKQKEMYEFLINSLVYSIQEINGKKLVLVHATPPGPQPNVDMMTKYVTFEKYRNVRGEDYTTVLLEDREEMFKGTFEMWKEKGYLTICGHTYTEGRVVRDKEKGMFRIDAGCGHRGKLALFCLEDRNVEYLDEREEEKGTVQGGSGGR